MKLDSTGYMGNLKSGTFVGIYPKWNEFVGCRVSQDAYGAWHADAQTIRCKKVEDGTSNAYDQAKRVKSWLGDMGATKAKILICSGTESRQQKGPLLKNFAILAEGLARLGVSFDYASAEKVIHHRPLLGPLAVKLMSEHGEIAACLALEAMYREVHSEK
jgi:hypothetical protein